MPPDPLPPELEELAMQAAEILGAALLDRHLDQPRSPVGVLAMVSSQMDITQDNRALVLAQWDLTDLERAVLKGRTLGT